jgi:hypothetical protein
MSKTTLNTIAAVLFVIAAVLLLVSGRIFLGIIFALLAAISVYQLAGARSARARRPGGPS